jgi:DNA-binding transcriptional MerR regulator
MERKFTVKDLSEMNDKITYRTINHWDEKGYLLTETDTEGWRKFSFVDYVWILLLDELRELDVAVKNIMPSLFVDFGFPYDVLEEMEAVEIEKLKKMDFENLLKEIDRDYALENFCKMLIIIISYKTPLTLRFFKDGSSFPIYGNPAYHGIKFKPALDEYNKALIESNFQSSVSVSIDSLIKDFIDKKSLDNIIDLKLFSDKEIEILELLKNNQLKEITIYMEKGKAQRIQILESFDNFDITKRVKEGFCNDYQSCRYVTNGGKTVTLERTTSKRL